MSTFFGWFQFQFRLWRCLALLVKTNVLHPCLSFAASPQPFTNWDPHELCIRCRPCGRAEQCEICAGFDATEWALIGERLDRYSVKTDPVAPSSVRSVFVQ